MRIVQCIIDWVLRYREKSPEANRRRFCCNCGLRITAERCQRCDYRMRW